MCWRERSGVRVGEASKLRELCLGLSCASTTSVYQVRPGPNGRSVVAGRCQPH